ncbi:transcriptional regulator, HxlR family [Micromonospora halophytica]|uniref:Transcriptional regulator, HxlR family n=2 Tax=Micromonospora halophytica TaxID=47864 RepID=A0A1C5ITX9_9ACTN|nr:transcriptional regulator, HxlR family [Micromonospora halophytica]
MYCAVARALEVLGERWTLLVVRELLTGPKRYADLYAGLPGIATNMLAERLRSLHNAGVVTQRTLPPPAASTVYELTERGRALRPVLLALGAWGLPLLGAPRDGEQFRLAWLMIALDGGYDPAGAAQPVTLALHVGDEVLTVRAHGAEHTVSEGCPSRPDLVLRADPDTFLAWATGQLTDEQALSAGMTVTHGVHGLRRVRRMYPSRASASGPDAE